MNSRPEQPYPSVVIIVEVSYCLCIFLYSKGDGALNTWLMEHDFFRALKNDGRFNEIFVLP